MMDPTNDVRSDSEKRSLTENRSKKHIFGTRIYSKNEILLELTN